MGPCILWCWSHRDGKEGINAPGLATQIGQTDQQTAAKEAVNRFIIEAEKNMLQLGILVLLAAVGE